MSMYFRCIAALSRTFPQVKPSFRFCCFLADTQGMAPASIFSLALVIHTGFTIPTKKMHPWFRWINYLNLIGYPFEALMINEVRTSYLYICQV